MHDTAYTREPETVMMLAFQKAGYYAIDPENTALPVTFEREPRPEDPVEAAAAGWAGTATEAACDHLARFSAAPGRDEFDTREVCDEDDAKGAIGEAIRILLAGVAVEGTQLHDERERLLSGFVEMLHDQRRRLDRTVDRILPELEEHRRAQDGTEIAARQLEMLTHRAENLTARRDAFERLRDFAAGAYLAETGEVWRPRRGSHTSKDGALTSSAIDARDFVRARKAEETKAHLPVGTLIAVAGGDGIADGHAIWAICDRVREKYPDMVLVHGGASGAQKIAASWADAQGVEQVVCRPDWKKHGRAAPFRRNVDMLNLLPRGIVAFPGSGITGNLVDKARQLGIPVWPVRA